MAPVSEAHLRGALIRLRREADGQTLGDLAAQLDVSQPFLSKLERGEVKTSSILEDLIKALDLADYRMEVQIDSSGRLSATLHQVRAQASSS